MSFQGTYSQTHTLNVYCQLCKWDCNLKGQAIWQTTKHSYAVHSQLHKHLTCPSKCYLIHVDASSVTCKTSLRYMYDCKSLHSKDYAYINFLCEGEMSVVTLHTCITLYLYDNYNPWKKMLQICTEQLSDVSEQCVPNIILLWNSFAFKMLDGSVQSTIKVNTKQSTA